MQNTNIEWADMTWNPVSGCSKVSAGCKFCYAETVHRRFHTRLGDFNSITIHPEKLGEPLRHKKPKRIFVNSMSDLFHEEVPFEFISHVFEIMRLSDHHTYMILTKRPEKILKFMELAVFRQGKYAPINLPNVWLGVSLENQEQANLRIPLLLKVPAAVRFLSCEPLLGWINLSKWLMIVEDRDGIKRSFGKIDWVIVGGESGHHARPMHPDWALRIRNQCLESGVPFFFKQWGGWLPLDHLPDDHSWSSKKTCEVGGGWTTNTMVRVGKKNAGNTLCGQQHLEFPKSKQP